MWFDLRPGPAKPNPKSKIENPKSFVAALFRVHDFERQFFLVPDGWRVVAGVLPRGDVREIGVVALRIVLGGLVFLAEVAAAGLVALQRVLGEQLAELQEVGHAPGVFQLLIEGFARAEDADIRPELFTQ